MRTETTFGASAFNETVRTPTFGGRRKAVLHPDAQQRTFSERSSEKALTGTCEEPHVPEGRYG